MCWPKSYSYAIVSGGLFAFAWPTGGFAPLIFFAFAPLLYYIGKHSLQPLNEVFITCFPAFLIWNLSAAWWMCQYDFIGGVSVILINSACMAGVMTFFAWFDRHLGVGWLKYFAFVSFWLSWEWVQLHWDLSWPWLVLGNSFSPFAEYVQWYEFTGVFGGSLWILLVNVLMTEILIRIQAQRSSRRALVVVLPLVVLLILVPMRYSLHLFEKPEVTAHRVKVLLVQPNTDPKASKSRLLASSVREKTLGLIMRDLDSATQLVVIPETAIIETISEERVVENPTLSALRGLQEKFPRTSFVVGAVTTIGDGSSKKTYNSAIALLKHGRIEFYRKAKLVPGVEEYPFELLAVPLMRFLDRGTFNPKFTRGDSQNSVSIDEGTNVGIAICYESIYGEYLSQLSAKKAGLIAMITNDGWWDQTDGYRQHLAYSRLRAIETRTPVVRAGNTGISCVIDQKGRIVRQTEWGSEQTLKSAVNITPHVTFYARQGDYILTMANLITLLLVTLLGLKILLNDKKRER